LLSESLGVLGWGTSEIVSLGILFYDLFSLLFESDKLSDLLLLEKSFWVHDEAPLATLSAG
jgi:hypothetical protein